MAYETPVSVVQRVDQCQQVRLLDTVA